MKLSLILLTLIFICVITGCNGSSITPLELSGIKGPATVNEQGQAQYSVEASGDYDLTFQWTLDPPAVGFLKGDTTKKVTLYTYELDETAKAKLTLVVETAKLGPVKQSKEIEVVNSNQPPEAKAHSDKTIIGDGQYVQFYDDSTDDNGVADIYNREWDFSYDQPLGFKSESNEREPNHQFMDAGTFQVQLRVTDYAGHMDMLDEPLTIDVIANTPPEITAINHPRTTSQAGNSAEAVSLGVVFSDMLPDDDTHEFLWTATDGTFDDPASRTPIWSPPANAADCEITVRVTDSFGLFGEGAINQWATDMPVLHNPNAADDLIVPQVLDSVFTAPINTGSFRFPNIEPDGNVVFVAFWASYASQSVADMPTLLDIYNMFRDRDYVHICINVGETAADVQYFVNSNSYDASYWLLDHDSTYFGLMNNWAGDVGTISMYLLFDRDGRCRWAYAGALTPTITNSIEQAIEELL
jgi:PKD repeat protein